MGFLNKVLTQPKMTFAGWGGQTSASGETVTQENALNLSAVYACINVKANAVAKLPIHVFQKTNDGSERRNEHEVAYLLETRPNPNMTPFMFKHLYTVHRNLYGVAYIRKHTNRRGKTFMLTLIHPKKVTTAIDPEGKTFYVEQTVNTKNPNIFDEDEIIRLFYLSTDGFTPKSPIDVARETIGTMKKQQKFLGSFYQNGTLSRGVLKIPTQLNKDAKDKVRQAWLDHTSGEDNASKVAVLDAGLTYENLTLGLEDQEFITSMRFGVEEIARIYNVPLHMIADLTKSSFSNIEQQSLDFVLNTVAPEVISFEEEAGYKLFTTSEQKKGFYIKANLTSALRGDSTARANFYKVMKEAGIYSINEIRKLEEMNRIEHGDGHYVSLNYVEIAKADEYQMLKATQSVKEVKKEDEK